MSYLEETPGLADDTDIFITSDHGFSTISKRELHSAGTEVTTSYAATQTYKDAPLNNMAAIGPDFKKAFIDIAPVSNADIAATLAHVLHLELPKNGHLTGRIIDEALAGGPQSIQFESGTKESEANTAGMKTRLSYQEVGETWYFDSAGFEQRTVGLPSTNK